MWLPEEHIIGGRNRDRRKKMTKGRRFLHILFPFLFLVTAVLFQGFFNQSVSGEEHPLTLAIDVDRESMTRGESFILFANLSEEGTISIEIDDPNNTIVYLKTVTTDDKGHARIELKAGKEWSFGSYTIYASASSSDGELKDTAHVTLVPILPPLYPDFSLSPQNIWLGFDINSTFHASGKQVNISTTDKDKVLEKNLLVFVKVYNLGDITGSATVKVFINKRNSSNFQGATNLSLAAKQHETLTFPLPPRFITEKENVIRVLVFIEDITPEDKNALDNRIEKDFTIVYLSEEGDSPVIIPLPASPIIPISFSLVIISTYLYTDQGRSKLFSLFLFLETRALGRKREEEIVEHTIRGMIYQYIKISPLCRVCDIKNSVAVANGTLYYHLGWLEKKEYIHSKNLRTGKKVYWSSDLIFPDKKRYPNEMYPPLLNETRRLTASVLFLQGPLTMKEISEKTSISSTTINDNLRPMRRAKMVVREKGFPSRYSLEKDYEGYYREYEMKIQNQ